MKAAGFKHHYKDEMKSIDASTIENCYIGKEDGQLKVTKDPEFKSNIETRQVS
jgi:hypothetical protein